MDHKEKDNKQAVSDHVEFCKKEKVKGSFSAYCGAEDESVANEAIAAKNHSPVLRVCDICGKTFNSGKALGGHRRSHFQKQQQKKVKVRFTSKAGDSSNRANYDCDDYGGKHVCCICKKEFPTKNSLFGHMRSHPERSWRGVSPSAHSHKHSSSPSSSYSFSSLNSDSIGKNKEDDDDECVGGDIRVFASDEYHKDAIDLSMFISPSWVKKDIRGRKCFGRYEAAETLAYLSANSKLYSDRFTRVFHKKDEVLSMSAPPLIKHGKRKIGISSSNKKHEVRIKFYLRSELKIGNKTEGAGECGDDEGDKNRCKGLSEYGLERISCMDDEDEENLDEGFGDGNAEVITPARVQDHLEERKVKRIDQKVKSGKKLVLKPKAKDTEYKNGSKQEKVGGYKCGACGKVFATFQGLGGHRSVHKEKNIATMDESNISEAVAEENNSSSSSNMHKVDEVATTLPAAEEACQSPGTKKLEFDLNELPCFMEE